MKLSALVFIVSATLFSLALQAQDAGRPCSNDIKKYCQEAIGDRQEIGKCLTLNESKLEPACQQRVQKAKNKLQGRGKDMALACKDDLKKFCEKSGKGKGDKMKCLEQNKAKLAPKCQAQFKS